MHVLFACRKFDGVVGGVERMSTTLMNALVARGHHISLLTWDENPQAQAYYHLDDKIVWHRLAMGNPDHKASWSLRLKRALHVRALLKSIHPDCVLAFQNGQFISIKIYGLGLGLPMICAERNSPFRHAFIKSFPPFKLACQLMRLADAITVQFPRYRDGYPAYLQKKIIAIANHVFPATTQADPVAENQNEKILISTGRFSYEKNFQALLQAFAKIAPAHPDWKLVLVGDGKGQTELEAVIKTFPDAVRSRIELHGASKNIPEWLSKAQLFCLPSRWEGFPNALAEAMAHGLPAVGYAGCDGVCDLIENNVTGLLASGNGDVDTLAQQLDALMSDKDMRQRFGNAAYIKSLTYAPDKIFTQWEQTLRAVAEGKLP